jgi:hypothetical protein
MLKTVGLYLCETFRHPDGEAAGARVGRQNEAGVGVGRGNAAGDAFNTRPRHPAKYVRRQQ